MTSDAQGTCASPPLRFAGFELRPDERVLLIGGRPARIGPRAFDVLLTLVERRDRVVSKNELLELVWPDSVVEENNLQVHVWALRKLLGPQALSTVPGRGYRLTAPLADAPAPAPAPAPALPPLSMPRTLPTPDTTLVGRDDDLRLLGQQLDSERLVTLVGAGGVGKTHLALHLLQTRAASDDIVWVGLSPLSEAAQVAAAVCAALGVANGTLPGLVAALRAQRLLLALDNAEHLLDAVAALARALLEGAGGVSLLVTSQASLNLDAESIYRLEPLAVPPRALGVQDALSYGAVALFVQRARAADRHFVLSPSNLPSVVEICARLDGLALAIELAAARVSLLGARPLAAALDERFRVLAGRRRGAPARQQALEAALDWSHGLLGQQEQAIFRRLAAFCGGFTLPMAVQVAGDREPKDDDERWALIDALAALVDRSFIHVDAGPGSGMPRYRMLETPRAYALAKLAASGEQPALQARHAGAVRSHLEALSSRRHSGEIGTDEYQALVQPDLDNAREAMAWALRHDAAEALALAPMMALALREHRAEERRLWEGTAELAADPAHATLPMALRARWALGCAHFWAARRPEECVRWAELAADLCQQLGDTLSVYLALSDLASSDPSAESPRQRQALAELGQLDDPSWPAWVRARGAMAEQRACSTRGDLAGARAAAQRMLVLAERSGSAAVVNGTLANLADLELAMGLVDEAVAHGRELEQRLLGSRHQMNLAFARVNLAAALLAKGALAEARSTAQAGWPLAANFDTREYWADYLALLAALEKRPRCAARLLGYGRALHASIGSARQANEAQAMAKATAQARTALGEAEFERLLAEGATLSDAGVPEIAFAATDLR